MNPQDRKAETVNGYLVLGANLQERYEELTDRKIRLLGAILESAWVVVDRRGTERKQAKKEMV